MDVLDDFADLKKFAQDINRCERTVRRYCAERDGLPHTRLGNRILIPIPLAREWLLKRIKNDPTRSRRKAGAS
jgi:hypothetical protein